MLPYYSAPVMDRLFEHFVTHGEDPSSLIGIFEQAWFHKELAGIDIVKWFPLIILYNPEYTSKILEALINQIILSQGWDDINIPLESLYHCLMVITPEQNTLRDVGQTLSWAMNCAKYARNPPVDRNFDGATDILKLVTIGRKRIKFGIINDSEEQIERADAPPFELRNFDFMQDMSDEEWIEWNARMKILILGTKLNGLKHGPSYNKDRFSRDPDGVCPCIPMS
jgi:hypothetical protein